MQNQFPSVRKQACKREGLGECSICGRIDNLFEHRISNKKHRTRKFIILHHSSFRVRCSLFIFLSGIPLCTQASVQARGARGVFNVRKESSSFFKHRIPNTEHRTQKFIILHHSTFRVRCSIFKFIPLQS